MTGTVSLLTSIRNYVDALVHPSAQEDAPTAARHRAFIAPRLLGSLVVLAAFPIYLAMRGVPSPLEVGVFAWLMAPILCAYFLARTGRYECAHVLSSLALTGLVTAVAWRTGGIASFAAIWLVVVPLDAALSASRRVVAVASTLVLGATGLLLVLSYTGLLPPPGSADIEHGALTALGIISASLYAIGLALGAESLARTSFWLLYAEEDRYRLLVQNITDVISRHGRNGDVLFISPAAEPLFGVGLSELVGHGLFDRVHVADRPAYLTALADAATLSQARSVEFRIRRDGAEGCDRSIWVEMRCRPLGQAITSVKSANREVVAVLRDVSERKAQEAAVKEVRAEAERANAGKHRFLATMSHELRTPLNAIIGFSDMLKREDTPIADEERRREYAKLINDSGQHLLSLVNGILDMSKINTGNFEITPELFAPAPVLTNCCDMLALKARETGVDLALRLACDLPDLVADKRAFNQILINLLSNAIKFTDRGGRVTLSAAREAAYIVLTVEDTGVGIDADDLQRLGEAFFQARASYDRRHDGTGLGLSIVKELVNLHAGTIKISSRLGEGTHVVVRLPIVCEGMRPPAKSAPIKPTVADTIAEAPERVKKSA